MRRLMRSIAWAVALVLLLARVPSAGDPKIDALLQAEREARAKYANALGELAKAVKAKEAGEIREILHRQNTTNDAYWTAHNAAKERRAAEARNINKAEAATEARRLSEAVADRTRDAHEQGDLSFARFPLSHARAQNLSVDELVEEGLRQFDAEEARKDLEMAVEREIELLNKEADRLEAKAKKPWASEKTKAEATTAREAAVKAAAHPGRARGRVPQPLSPPPPKKAEPTTEAPPKKAEPATETGPSGSEQPPHIDPFPFIQGHPRPGDPAAFGTGGQPVSNNVNMTVVMESRREALFCIQPGVDAAKVATALALASHQVIAMKPTGTVIAALGDPETIETRAKAKGIDLCFVEINYCMIMTPLTAFRGHIHELHRGRLHDHDAPDPPWNWSVTPPEPVVSWGGR